MRGDKGQNQIIRSLGEEAWVLKSNVGGEGIAKVVEAGATHALVVD